MKKLLTIIVLCFVVFTLSAKTMTNPAPDSVYTFTSKLYYPVNVTKRIDSYMENAIALKAMATLKKGNFTVESIKISGWASPESPIHYNQMLSEKRAATIKKVIKDQYGFPEDLFIVEGRGEQWSGIVDLIDSDDEVACKYMEDFKLAMAKENSDEREKAIKAIGNGELYKYIFATVYPKMRYADCEIKFRCSEMTVEDAEILGIKLEQPVQAPVVVPAPIVETPAETPAPVEEVVTEQPAPEPEEVIENNGFWRISLVGGPQVYRGDNDKYMDYGDRIRFGFYGNFERWFNNYIGIGLGINGYRVNGLYHDHYDLNDDDPRWRKPEKGIYKNRDGKNYYWQKTWIFDPYIYVVTNLTNDFGGLKEGGRMYNLLFNLGAGVPFSECRYHKKVYGGFSINASLINSFRLTDNLAFLVTLNGAGLNDNFDGEVSKHLLDGTYSVMAGLSVQF